MPNHGGRYVQRIRKGIGIPWARRRFHDQTLVKNYCLTKCIELDSDEGRDVARALLKWFQIGVTDKSRLQELLASRT